ncbi:MAG TPA: hypothetical protein VI504_17720 [Candidatus Eisenbacteria bacterium]|jgi:hypothetical protein
MDHREEEVRLEGIVHASRFGSGDLGKPFLGAALECDDGRVWVIDYRETSPFHAFAGRRIEVLGQPYVPEGQHLIGWPGGKELGHFRVSNFRPVE